MVDLALYLIICFDPNPFQTFKAEFCVFLWGQTAHLTLGPPMTVCGGSLGLWMLVVFLQLLIP